MDRYKIALKKKPPAPKPKPEVAEIDWPGTAGIDPKKDWRFFAERMSASLPAIELSNLPNRRRASTVRTNPWTLLVSFPVGTNPLDDRTEILGKHRHI